MDLNTVDFILETNSISGIDELLQKGKTQLRHNKGDSAIYTFFRALAVSYHQKSPDLFKRSFNEFGKYVTNWGDNMDSSRAALIEKTLQWSRYFNIKNEHTQRLTYMLGSFYYDINEMETALNLMTKVIEFDPSDRSVGVNLLKAKALHSITGLWIYTGELDQAKSTVQQLAKLRVHTGDVHIGVYEQLAQGKIQLFLGNHDAYVQRLTKAIELSKTNHLNCLCSDIALSHLCEGYIIGKDKQPQRAIDTLHQLIKRYTLIGQEKTDKGFIPLFTPKLLLHYRFVMAIAYAYNDDLNAAEQGLVALLEENNPKKPLPMVLYQNTLRFLGAVYTSLGKYREANKTYETMIMLYDNHKVQREKSNSIALKHRLDREKSKMQQQLIIERQSNQLSKNRILMISGGIALSLLVVLAGAWYKAVKNKQQLHLSHLENLQKETQLQALQSRIEGEEQARKQIARELHDGISSRLLIAKLGLSSLNKHTSLQTGDRRLVADVLEQLDVVTQQLRSTAHNLTPDLILRQGLGFAIAAYLEKIKQGKLLAVDFQTFGSAPVLSEPVTLQLFRIIQESIQNTIKHAQATKLLVQLNNAADLFSITIEDNGIGFNPSNGAASGLGIPNMMKRMKELGGAIQLETQPGKGCTIYLEIDLQQEHLA